VICLFFITVRICN